MNAKSLILKSAMLLAALFMFVAASAESSAQYATCCALKVVNNTSCTIEACANPIDGSTPICLTVPPNTIVTVSFACMTFKGSIGLCGQQVGIPYGTCLNNVRLTNLCCADVCFDNCTITINPTPALNCPCS